MTADSDTITITLSDQSGLDPATGAAWVAGWINASPGPGFAFQLLQQDGTFGAAPNGSLFTVQATQPWQSTGIAISPAQTPVTITYVGGGWTADPATNSGQLYDAGGCPGVTVPTAQTLYPIVGVPMGGLIGRIGATGTPFFIGRGPYLVPSGFPSGVLELCIDDDLTGAYGAGLIDNSGSVSVSILAQGVPFYTVASIPNIQLSTATNGNERLVFVAAPSQPEPLPLICQLAAPLAPAPTASVPAANVTQYPPAPYINQPQPAPAGPFDFFEFGYNAAADMSAVNGLGLNLSFSYGTEQYGVDTTVSRAQIASAYTAFIANEGAAATPYLELLTNGALGTSGYTPPTLNDEFFALADPSDMLISQQNLNSNVTDPLASYWDSTLNAFFAVGNWLSIDLSGSNTNVYSGQSSLQTLTIGTTTVTTPAFTLSNGTNTYTYYQPPSGITGALYVVQQSFNDYQSGGSGGDSGLLQMNIWEALCRGVAVAGVSTTQISGGETTTAWNDFANWYAAGSTCDYYAKFLHYSTSDGQDCRLVAGSTPIFYGGAAYGFSADENPNGAYSGPNVPSKTEGDVPPGSTIAIVVGPF